MRRQGSVRLLRLAVDLLRARGWTQGAYENTSGQLCLVGALRKARCLLEQSELVPFCELDVAIKEYVFPVVRQIWDRPYQYDNGREDHVIAWNDDGWRTAEEVCDLLLTAAMTAEAPPEAPPPEPEPEKEEEEEEEPELALA